MAYVTGCTTNDHQPPRQSQLGITTYLSCIAYFRSANISKRPLTGDSVHPVPDVIPARHQQRAINLDELHVVDVHVEGVLLRPHKIPLLDLVNGQVEKHIAGSPKDFPSNRLTNLRHKQHKSFHEPIIIHSHFSTIRNKQIA